jgi:cytochrome c5
MRLAAPAGVAAGALLCAVISNAPGADAVTTSRAAEITDLKDAPGHDITVGSCIICHSVEYIPANAPAMDRASWQKSVQKMRERFGAPITDDEAKQILDYLAANYSGKRLS